MPSPTSAAQLPASPAGTAAGSPPPAHRRTPRATWESDEGEAEGGPGWGTWPAPYNPGAAAGSPGAATATSAEGGITSTPSASSSPQLSPGGPSACAGGPPAASHSPVHHSHPYHSHSHAHSHQHHHHRTSSHRHWLRSSAPTPALTAGSPPPQGAPAVTATSASPAAAAAPARHLSHRLHRHRHDQHLHLHHSASAGGAGHPMTHSGGGGGAGGGLLGRSGAASAGQRAGSAGGSALQPLRAYPDLPALAPLPPLAAAAAQAADTAAAAGSNGGGSGGAGARPAVSSAFGVQAAAVAAAELTSGSPPRIGTSLLFPASQSFARSSSPGGYPAGLPGMPSPPRQHHGARHHANLHRQHHTASAGGAALPPALSRSGEFGRAAAAAAAPTRLPPLLVTPLAAALAGPASASASASTSAPSSSRTSRLTADDVEVGCQDQAVPPSRAERPAGTPAPASRGSGGGAAPASASAKALPRQPLHTAEQPGQVHNDARGASGSGAQAAGPSISATAPAPAADTRAAPAADTGAAGAPGATGGSRLQLSVTVLGAPRLPAGVGAGAGAVPPVNAARVSGAGADGAMRAGDVPAAVGVPVLLLPPAAAAGGVLPDGTVVGRPAPHQAATAAVMGVPGEPLRASGGGGANPGPGAADVDAVATIVGTDTAGAGRRRRRTSGGGSGGGGGEGDESGVDEEATGPCALPAELRRRLRAALGRHRMKRIRTWKDLSYSMASPAPGYWQAGTLLLTAVLLGGFLFMAGQYEAVRAAEGGATGTPAAAAAATRAPGSPPSPARSPASPSAASPAPACWGPRCLAAWLAFWRPRASRTFSFAYLRAWGGRYAPDLAAGQWWRWLSSLLLHASPLHLASNLALLLVLSSYLESLYGCWRVLPVWLLAGVAGNMTSAFFESACTLVVGSSGAVFGLLGAYAADAGLNWESLPLLWLRLLGMAGLGGFMLALQLTDHGGSGGGGSVSNASHAGGFLVGLLAALVVTPDFKARRCEKVRRLLAGLGLESALPQPGSPGGRQLFSFWQRHRYLLYGLYGAAASVLLLALLALPLHLYLRTFPNMSCAA